MTSRILVSLRVATMPEHAFEMFVCEIGVWWRANALFRFTPRALHMRLERGQLVAPQLLGLLKPSL